MDEHCLVICGSWDVTLDGEWNFVVDKGKLSRIVPMKEGVTLSEFESDVFSEFGVSECSSTLSYWSSNSFELITGRRTPPVLVTTDVGLTLFQKLRKSKSDMNLFVAFEFGKKRGREEDSFESYGCKKRGPGIERSGSFGSKSSPFEVDDENLLKDVEEVEAEIRRSAVKRAPTRGPIVREVNISSSVGSDEADDKNCDFPTWSTGNDDLEGDVCSEETDDDDDDEKYVEKEIPLPRGYDTEFWKPFLDEELGGSNAVEVMCSSNDAFDHIVLLNGGGNLKTEKKAGTSSGSGGLTPMDNDCFSREDEAVPNTVPRKLEEINDEEFDIPPLFDDTLYETDEIPDLDYNDEKGMFKGKMFANKIECQIAIAIYAIKNEFHYKQGRTRRESFVVECSDERCDWRIFARETDYGCYELRKVYLEHTCGIETRSRYMEKATSRVIAAMYKTKFGKAGKKPKSLDLQELLLEDLRVVANYNKCWRAKEKAGVTMNGSDEDGYMHLAEYLKTLELSNPGTITEIKTEIEDGGVERFLYMFLAFGASIEGLRNIRWVLVVDGAHLSGKYKGVLLTASGQDANFQVFPLAFAIVDSENDDSWTWFFEQIKRIIADSKDLNIISDRQHSIYTAKKNVFPLAHHGACIVHLARNVTAKYKNKGLAKLVKNAAYAWTVNDFKDKYAKVKEKNAECAKWLAQLGMAHWTRVYFQGMRYNLMTSNIAESLNNALKGCRSSHILELLRFIRSMMTRWFNARRTKALKHGWDLTPEVDKVVTMNKKACDGSKVGMVSSWSVEVIGKFSGKHHVLLNDKKCTCKQYERLGIPCGHALVAADAKKLPHTNMVSRWYKTSTWAATYRGVVNPELGPENYEIPAEIRERRLLAPHTKRPSGRPCSVRIPSKGEIGKSNTMKVKVNRCSRCKKVGHNRVKCTTPI